MSRRGATHFVKEIEAVINRFRREYSMTYAEIIGSLELVKFDVLREASEDDDDDNDDQFESQSE